MTPLEFLAHEVFSDKNETQDQGTTFMKIQMDRSTQYHFDEENGKPLCDQCCLQKKKGSYCPLCEGCYDDNDYEARMMECATCGGWIHAKCEGVDAEKYQILSHLPNTIDYVCK